LKVCIEPVRASRTLNADVNCKRAVGFALAAAPSGIRTFNSTKADVWVSAPEALGV